MITTLEPLVVYLLACLRRLQKEMGLAEIATIDPDARFADLLDSMALVEFVALLAEDCGVTPEVIEQCVERRFGTVAELAAALNAAGIEPIPDSGEGPNPFQEDVTVRPLQMETETAGWLAGVVARLPEAVQSAAAINTLLNRPPGWLESHAGIQERRLWLGQDPLTESAWAGRQVLERAKLTVPEVGCLLVVSEAPPLLVGLAAALHHRLGLSPESPALEVGGACTGFLTALWLGRALLPRAGVVLILAVEAPSRFLTVAPGPAGEAAALFGDGAAAVLLCQHSPGGDAVPLVDILLGAEGEASGLIQVDYSPGSLLELRLDGGPLASRALAAMSRAARVLARSQKRALEDFQAVVAHGGNGRLPALLARQLGLPPNRVWSETARTGNLGSASLPVAWAAHQPGPTGPVLWTAAGAGLTWGAAITGPPER